jgi:hypothetical protein
MQASHHSPDCRNPQHLVPETFKLIWISLCDLCLRYVLWLRNSPGKTTTDTEITGLHRDELKSGSSRPSILDFCSAHKVCLRTRDQ